MVKNFTEKTEQEEDIKKKEEAEDGAIKNRGKLILDASCAPADITYPNDLGILNQARKQTEKIINSLYKNRKNKLDKKPITYKKKARKDYLKVAKKRRPSRKERIDAIAKQLQYIKRNLSQIEKLINAGAELSSLSPRKSKMLLVVTEVYRQPTRMYENESNRIDDAECVSPQALDLKSRERADRIVSISQPHIRPIVRGKAGKPVEFGAKIESLLFRPICVFRPSKLG